MLLEYVGLSQINGSLVILDGVKNASYDEMVQLRLDQILYIEGVKDYVKIHTEDGASVMTLMSMKAIEETLPADRFVRVHRSFIVHVDKIKTIERNRIVFGKEHIPISDNYKPRLVEFLAQRALNFN